MSERLINSWLDNECDESDQQQLEQLLREDAALLERFLDVVGFQEELRVHFVGRSLEGGILGEGKLEGGNVDNLSSEESSATLPDRQRQTIRLVVSIAVAAALVLATVFLLPRMNDRSRPTNDPLVRILAGNPQVELRQVPPGPNPAPIPRDQWPSETQVTVEGEASSIRWDDDCVLEAQPGAKLALRMNDVEAANFRAVHLSAGQLTVRLEASGQPVDVLVGDSIIRATRGAVFTLAPITERQPFGQSAELTVSEGSVSLLITGDEERKIQAGELVPVP